MAIKQLVVSDIGGAELSDDSHARVVVEHPDFPTALELDTSTDEAEKFQNTALRLVKVTVYAPNVPPRTVTLETKTVDKLFGSGVDFNNVLEGARKAVQTAPQAAVRRGRPAGASTTAKTAKVDYSDPQNAGRPHRGRLTEAEKQTVRDNLDAVNKRLISEGHPSIDKNDPRMKEKWNL